MAFNKEAENVIVSVHMITYNHEQYIADAIEGVLKQQVNFSIELIISNDCSTDNTHVIVERYAKQYPDLIKYINREKNIGSIVNFLDTFTFCKGKYIAICEGDDYWTDPFKLQKQVDFMEANPDCSMCFHHYKIEYLKGSQNDSIEGSKIVGVKKFSSEEIIGRKYVRTVTVLFRAIIINPIPEWFFKAPYGDYPLQLVCAHNGKTGYLGGEPMSVYRRGVLGAWSEKQSSKNIEEQEAWKLKRLIDHIRCFDLFDEYTSGQYRSIIKKRIRRWVLRFLFYYQDNHTRMETLKMVKKYLTQPFNIDKLSIMFWVRFVLGSRLYNITVRRNPAAF